MFVIIMERDRNLIEEIRKLCKDNKVDFEETVSSKTPSSNPNRRFEFVKEMNKQGKSILFL